MDSFRRPHHGPMVVWGLCVNRSLCPIYLKVRFSGYKIFDSCFHSLSIWNVFPYFPLSQELLWSVSQSVSCFSCVRLFATLWTVACQGPLSMGILQARILEWVVISSCRGSSQPRDQTLMSCVSCTLAFFTTSATWETLVSIVIVCWKPNFTLSHMLFCPMSKWLFLFLFQVQQFY